MSLEQQQTAAQTEGQQKNFIDQIVEAITPIIEKMEKGKDAVVISVLTDGDKEMSQCMVAIAGTTQNVCNAIDAMNNNREFAKVNLIWKLHHAKSIHDLIDIAKDCENGK